MKLRYLFLAAVLFAGACSRPSETFSTGIIPVPQHVNWGEGTFRMPRTLTYVTDLEGQEKADLAAWMERSVAGRFFPVPFVEALEGDIPALRLRIADKGAPESYRLDVVRDSMTITAPDAAGLFYGLQSLLQLMKPDKRGGWTVPAVTVKDSPRFGYRGFMIDVSRHFRPKEFVKKQIDAMARYKLNRLHLHLTDAAGWRLEIKKYPLLTEFAAWRTDANWKKWWNGGRKYLRFDEPGASGGYYTQDDMKEIIAYAQQHYITIIPEIEMPAHSEEVLAAYPQLSCSGEPYKNADFCVGNEETFTFLENVLTEVMELFPSEYIHVGGDEAGKAAWKTCPKCQKRMQDEHLSNVDELQSYLIHRIELFLNAHGRKLLGWDEILQGGLAPNATVMSWRGEEGGIAAVRSGHQAIMTPGQYCYLDSYQDAPYSQPEAIGGYLPLEKVYSYNPVSDSLTVEQAKLVYGVQANLWAEYIPTPEHMEYMIYPRILALAEVAWSASERKSWTDFHNRALKAVDDLQAKGYHTFDLKNEIGSRPESLKPISHLAVGKKVIYNAPYSPHYPAQGNTALTDGIRGDWTYGDGSWQGFIDKKRLDVTIDMGTETAVHSVSADFMQVVGAEVFLPESVTISISDDGANFTELKQYTFEVNRKEAIKFISISWEGSAEGRYIRYQARAGEEFGGWIFTDEIVVK